MNIIAIARNIFYTVLSEFCMYSRIVQVGVNTATDFFGSDHHGLVTTHRDMSDGVFHVRDASGASRFINFTIEESKRHLLDVPTAEVIQSIFEQGYRMGLMIENLEVFSKTERRLYKRNSYTPLSVLSI